MRGDDREERKREKGNRQKEPHTVQTHTNGR